MFVYILMLGREEWVLVELGSQQKCVKRPVRPVFPDYLSVSHDYDYNNNSKELNGFFNRGYDFVICRKNVFFFSLRKQRKCPNLSEEPRYNKPFSSPNNNFSVLKSYLLIKTPYEFYLHGIILKIILQKLETQTGNSKGRH